MKYSSLSDDLAWAMRIPQKAPPTASLLRDLTEDPDRLVRVLKHGRSSATVNGRYLHWDQLRHRTPPSGLTHEDWWTRIKFARGSMSHALPLKDATGRPFTLATPDVLLEALHKADCQLSGRVDVPSSLTTPGIRDRYQMSALIEEAIASSQLEGAATTRRVANEMLRSGRQPRDGDERMIFNNYHAMEFIRDVRAEPLSPDLVLEVHRITTQGTLEDPASSGRLRTAAESEGEWGVWAPDGTFLHRPPPAEQLRDRLEAYCAFANDTGEGPFIHPVVRSVLLHFWMGFDHPFVDGNGRTARALFYWSMLNHGYWLAEFLSVSHILKRAPVKYAESYLHSETDDNDSTYFVLYQLDVLRRATEALRDYVSRKAGEVRATHERLKDSGLNHRQIALLSHALMNPDAVYTVRRHATSHRVTPPTARADLRELATLGFLGEFMHGRAVQFEVQPDLEDLLRAHVEDARTRPSPRGRGRPPRPTNRRPGLPGLDG